MANIDDYLVASYRCNGKGNSDADRDVLKDLSGNGHDIVLKNFGFTLGSGYEGGALVFDGIDDYGICENFPAINDFTFVYKRINLNPSKSTNCFLSKSVSTNQAQQFCSELAYSKNVYVRLGSKDIAVKDIYNPELSIVYVTKESYNGEMDLVSSNYTSTVDNLYIGTFSRGVQAYVWNGALYALDIYDRTLSDEYLQKALNRMNDIDINWKDGVGEVTDQHLTVSPGSGTGNAAVSFGSVMNNGLDRTLELEITTPKGTKKILTVNQEGCRQAYVTSDGKRWLTSDNRVYGVLKGDAPCQCFDTGMRGVARFRIDDKKQISVIDSCGDSSWIKGRRCLVKKTDAGVAICYLDENNSELFHDGKTQAKLDGTMGQWMTDIPSYRYSYTGFKHDNNYDIINYITLTHNDVDDNITKWGNKGLFRRCLVGVTEAVVVNSKLWSRKTGDEYSTGNLESRLFHDYATALGAGFDIIDYETHCKIAHLFYAKYADRNPQGMDRFGTGEDSFDRIIGTTSSLGNNDGKTSTQISFLGIEDFYGGKSEFMGGIGFYGKDVYIYDGFNPYEPPTVDYRVVYSGMYKEGGGIYKVVWGEHGDMIPKVIDMFSSNFHYCDFGYIDGSNGRWQGVTRSGYGASLYNGVAFFSDGGSWAYEGTRIQYRGTMQVIDDPADFITMPIGF